MDKINLIGPKWTEWTKYDQSRQNKTNIDQIGPEWTEQTK